MQTSSGIISLRKKPQNTVKMTFFIILFSSWAKNWLVDGQAIPIWHQDILLKKFNSSRHHSVLFFVVKYRKYSIFKHFLRHFMAFCSIEMLNKAGYTAIQLQTVGQERKREKKLVVQKCDGQTNLPTNTVPTDTARCRVACL